MVGQYVKGSSSSNVNLMHSSATPADKRALINKDFYHERYSRWPNQIRALSWLCHDYPLFSGYILVTWPAERESTVNHIILYRHKVLNNILQFHPNVFSGSLVIAIMARQSAILNRTTSKKQLSCSFLGA